MKTEKFEDRPSEETEIGEQADKPDKSDKAHKDEAMREKKKIEARSDFDK